MSMSPFAFLYLLLLLIVFSTPVMLQEGTQANCSHACNATVPSFLNNSSMDVGPSTMDTLVPVTPPSPTDGGNTSRVTRTTAPLSPGTTHTTRPLQDQVQGSTTATKTTPEAGSTLGTSSLASASTNSTATLSQQEHTTASLAGPGRLSPGTSATAKNTPPTDSLTTSVSTPIPTKTTSPSSPLLRATSPDQTSPSTASPAARTVATSTSTTTTTSTSTELLPGTKDAVPEVVEVPLTTHLVDTASLLAIVLFGLVFFLITVAVFAVQAYESYKMKDYTQVDYLINGMYNDSGV